MNRVFWFWWFSASALGAAGGGAAIPLVGRENLAWLIGLGMLGLLVGLAQSLVLRRVHYLKSARLIVQWTLANLIGWTLGGIAGVIATLGIVLFLMSALNVDYTWAYQHGETVLWVLCVILGATTLAGLEQWILRRALNSPVRWMWTSVVGWVLAWGVGLGVTQISPGSSVIKGLVGGALGGIVVGMITGYALVGFLPVSQRSNNSASFSELP